MRVSFMRPTSCRAAGVVTARGGGAAAGGFHETSWRPTVGHPDSLRMALHIGVLIHTHAELEAARVSLGAEGEVSREWRWDCRR